MTLHQKMCKYLPVKYKNPSVESLFRKRLWFVPLTIVCKRTEPLPLPSAMSTYIDTETISVISTLSICVCISYLLHKFATLQTSKYDNNPFTISQMSAFTSKCLIYKCSTCSLKLHCIV